MSEIPIFRNRQTEVDEILIPAEDQPLLNLYGEAGIGKSRLLEEAYRKISLGKQSSIVMIVDFDELTSNSNESIDQLLRLLIRQADGRLHGGWQSSTEAAVEIARQLSAYPESVYLFFDTTEKFRKDDEFWKFLEGNLIGPLVRDKTVKMVFAGRIPVSWKRVEIRRALTLLPLEPLDVAGTSSADTFANQVSPGDAGEIPGQALVREVLERRGYDGDPETAVELVLKFTFGHPLLSQRLAQYVANYSQKGSVKEEGFERQVCQEVVEPFVNERFFEGVKDEWRTILWKLSVLDWFDTTILRRYLERLDRAVIASMDDYSIIKGLANLRLQHAVVWQAQQGNTLHGVIGKITRRCLITLKPALYKQACEAATTTFNIIAEELAREDLDDEKVYREAAEQYREYAKEVA